MAEVEFYIICHGETLLNKLGKAQGLTDSPLTSDGIQSAVKLKQALCNVEFSTAYSSDLSRAYNTAKIICGNFCDVHKDTRLREWCLGNFEAENSKDFIKHILNCNKNLKANELNQHLPEICNTIKLTDTTGMAETFDDITKRLISFLKDVGKHHLNFVERKILVVTHAFVIKTILHMFAYSELKNTDKISNSSATVITYDGSKFNVKAVNKLLF